MIFYNYNRDVLSDFINYIPRSCFIMTQLGQPFSKVQLEIRASLTKELVKREIKEIDANTYVTGKDFLDKIWKIILSVPMGIAIITEDMKCSTLSNIFYEIGVLNAFGKETIVIKTPDATIPTDFIRTEYINFDKTFKKRINNFFDQVFSLTEFYTIMAEQFNDPNPILSIDYWRRAYLISGDIKYLNFAKKLFKKNVFDQQSSFYISNFLSTEKRLEKNKKLLSLINN